jgi:hypothetical protein
MKTRLQVAGCRLQGTGKRGLISNFIAFFGATIAIVVILIIYVIGGAVITKLDKKAVSGIVVMDEGEVGVDDIFKYSDGYVLKREIVFLVADEVGVSEAIVEVGYEK